MFKILTSSTFFLFWSLSAVAQSNTKNSVDSLGIMKWLSKSFSFNKPDTGFIHLSEGNGYSNKNIGATIKYITFPSLYSKTKAEFLEEKSTETSLILNIEYHKVNNQEAVSIIREEISPDQLQYENFITITTIMGFENISICIIGAYPKSKDSLLRKKYIEASLTLKQE
ncbi:hypothetical protein [Sediminibacterium sp.]|uniref:hypothetical protein n=1 Tax=Sediminibacterium sp. TaxID=1917865 RepID=UPI003F709BBA